MTTLPAKLLMHALAKLHTFEFRASGGNPDRMDEIKAQHDDYREALSALDAALCKCPELREEEESNYDQPGFSAPPVPDNVTPGPWGAA
jgi:hypothetical protein